MAGGDYQDLVNMRRELMSIGALAMVVVQADDSPPVIELSVGDMSQVSAIPVLYVQAHTIERAAKDETEAYIMFDAVAGAQEFVTGVLNDYTPSLILLEAEDVKVVMNEHDVPYVLPDVHRNIAKSLNETLKLKISQLNGALSSLQQAMSNAQDNFAASLEQIEHRVKQSDGRVLFLEHVIQDLQEGRITSLLEKLQKEKKHSETLQEQLYQPEVQAFIYAKKRSVNNLCGK